MKGGALIAFLIIGGAAIYVLWDVSRRRTISAPSSSTVNGYTMPDSKSTDATGGYTVLQNQIDALSLAVSAQGTKVGTATGSAVGSTAGAGVGSTIASGETAFAQSIGRPALSDAQANALASNSAQTGLVAGETGGANVSSAAGGAVGAGPFDFISAFLKGAAASELLRKDGVADRLGLPKWGG